MVDLMQYNRKPTRPKNQDCQLHEIRNQDYYRSLTSSSNRRSWMTLATARCFEHCALSMYFKANSFFDLLCSTTRTYIRTVTLLAHPNAKKIGVGRIEGLAVGKKSSTLGENKGNRLGSPSQTASCLSASWRDNGNARKRVGDIHTFPKAPFPTTR
jgi:hypothetical protein